MEENEEKIYKAFVEDRYPFKDYEDGVLPEHLPFVSFIHHYFENKIFIFKNNFIYFIFYFFFFSKFCFPEGLKLSKFEREPTFFCFTLTELSGERFYGACIQAHDKISNYKVIKRELTNELNQNGSDHRININTSVQTSTPTTTTTEDDSGSLQNQISDEDTSHMQEESSEKQGNQHVAMKEDVKKEESAGDNDLEYYLPRSICILSRYPFFSTFRECLREIYLIYRSKSPLPIESYLEYLINYIPLPPLVIPFVSKFIIKN